MNLVILDFFANKSTYIDHLLQNIGFITNPFQSTILRINSNILLEEKSSWSVVSPLINSNNLNDDIDYLNISTSEKQNFFIYEKELALTYNKIKKSLGKHSVLYILRSPTETALSLNKVHGYPFEFGLALWEAYNTFIINSINKENSFIIQYQDLQNNEKVKSELFQFLNKKDPSETSSNHALFESNSSSQSINHYVTNSQQDLYKQLKQGKIENFSFSDSLLLTLKQFEPFIESKNSTQNQDDSIVNETIDSLTIKNKALLKDLRATYDDVSSLTNSYRYKLGNRVFKTINLIRKKGQAENYHLIQLNKRFNKYFKDNTLPANFNLTYNIQNFERAQPNSYATPANQNRKKAIIVAWDLAHNPVGRAFLFAEFLTKEYDTTLIGPVFNKFGDDIWKPIKNRGLKIISFPGSNFPEFSKRAERATKDIKADLIIVCKPRIPSILIGSLLKEQNQQAPLFLDIDDNELSFFNNKTPLNDLSKIQLESKEDAIPYSENWTRYADSITSFADQIIVSNIELQKKYGGTVIPHVRNEDIFDPKLYSKEEIRDFVGYKPSDKVILFIGTPRYHKGIIQIANALDKINNDNIKLCVIGTLEDTKVIERLKKLPLDRFQNIQNIDFEHLPYYLNIGDLVCLYQDPTSDISKYQMPAKVTDALAMNIPIVASSVQPLKNLEKHQFITCCENENELHLKILEAFNTKPSDFRDYFEKTHSYNYGLTTIKRLVAETSTKSNFTSPLNILKHKEKTGAIDIVFFWKQNDSDIYGRRQDMFVKYLSKHPDINKIIHFDEPISQSRLNQLMSEDKTSQNHLVYENTISRISHEADYANIIKRTFCYTGQFSTSKYLDFISNELTNCNIDLKESIYWFCPIINSQKDIINHFSPSKVVNDIIDDQSQFTNDPHLKIQYKKQYKFALENSSLSLCNTNTVKDKFKSDGFTLECITNGAESFSDQELTSWPTPYDLKDIGRPILGYVGNLDSSRLNLNLIEEIATKFPKSNLVFIGSTHRGAEVVELANRYKNIYLLGVKKYEDALKYIQQFDIALIPHQNNEMTKYMNPLKLYNYASIGKPIITTELSGLNIEYNGLYVCKTNDIFLENIEQIMLTQAQRFILPDEFQWKNKISKVINILTS